MSWRWISILLRYTQKSVWQRIWQLLGAVVCNFSNKMISAINNQRVYGTDNYEVRSISGATPELLRRKQKPYNCNGRHLRVNHAVALIVVGKHLESHWQIFSFNNRSKGIFWSVIPYSNKKKQSPAQYLGYYINASLACYNARQYDN